MLKMFEAVLPYVLLIRNPESLLYELENLTIFFSL